jgi:hypothetical protein
MTNLANLYRECNAGFFSSDYDALRQMNIKMIDEGNFWAFDDALSGTQLGLCYTAKEALTWTRAAWIGYLQAIKHQPAA